MVRLLIAAALLSSSALGAEAPATAPAGGAVVTHTSGKWSLTVPEGWKWRADGDDEDPAFVVIYSPNVAAKDAKPDADLPPGQVVCRTEVGFKKKDASLSQDDLNKRAFDDGARNWELNRQDRKEFGGVLIDAARDEYLELRDAGGIVVLTGVDLSMSGYDKKPFAGFSGNARFSRPDGWGMLKCDVNFDKAAVGKLASDPTMKSLVSMLHSFKPL